MGLNKNYTLYFRSMNKYGHVFMIPILSMGLKDMDKYTSNYNNCLTMYNCLPNELKTYIKSIISNKVNLDDENYLKECFTLMIDNKTLPIIFRYDADVTYITPKELKEEIKSVMLDEASFKQALMISNDNIGIKLRYNFFKYLYETYLKEKEVIKMMDTYDASGMFPTLKGDKLMIASLATDKDNLAVLLKKIGQTSEGKRDVAIRYKELYIKIKGDAYLPKDAIAKRFNEGLNISKMKKEILNNLTQFKENYEKEYA